MLSKEVMSNTLLFHIVTTQNYIILECSSHIDDLLLFTPDELSGLNFEELIHPNVPEFVKGKFYELLDTKGMYQERLMLKNKKGSIVYAYILANKTSENIVFTIYRSNYRYNIFDIQYSDTLWSVLNELLKSAPIPIFAKLLDGTHILTNNEDAKYIGKEIKDILGKTNEEIFDEKTAKSIAKIEEEVLASKTPITREETISFNGKKYIFLTTRGVFTDEKGKVLGIYGIGQDITEKKQFEHNLLLSQRFNSLGKLIGGISHDFNNILSGIMGYASILERDLEGRDKEYTKLIVKSSEKARNLIKKLLDYSRKTPVKRAEVDMGKIISDIIDLIGIRLNKNIDLKIEIDKNLPKIFAEESQMDQLVLNLCINAIEAMEDGGILTIKSEIKKLKKGNKYQLLPGKFFVLMVQDTGCGISPEHLNQIFDPFFSTKTGPSSASYGLGLTSVYSIVKNHNGIIYPRSVVNKGTTMEILLPVVAAETKSDIIDSVKLNDIILREELSILVIDDNLDFNDAVLNMLKILNHKGITKSSGLSGIKYYEQHLKEIDFVITDMIMPDLNGMNVLSEIKRLNKNAVVVLTSGYEDNKKNEFFENGGADFIAKPFTIEELDQLIKKIAIMLKKVE